MLIERFEELKNRIEGYAEEGVIKGLDLLSLRDYVLDTEDYIENTELYYRINEFTRILNILEAEIDNALNK